ncbi:zinc finger BED domain-containing protein 4 [Microcaecilia unicolor]|uniref:Zinc finger BED domain-containing protein 4-like n=1 Tax=Microcaecilia unicolor TaxID=1415580 RepID=A0A6P7XQE0_9AMPH|nr:zinc finger BED domain-containing protein 4-like [Microcaecilia unicolor]
MPAEAAAAQVSRGADLYGEISTEVALQGPRARAVVTERTANSMAADPEVFLRIKEEDEALCNDHSVFIGKENNPSTSMIRPDISSVFSVIIKEEAEEEPYVIARPERRDIPITTMPKDSPAASRDPRRGSRKKSLVWRHFRAMKDQRFAECLHCWKTISRGKIVGHLSNTAMQYHLKKQHLEVLLAGEAGSLGNPSPTTSNSSSKGKEKRKSISQSDPLASFPSDDMGEQTPPQWQATMEQMGWYPTELSQGKKQTPSKVITRYIGEMIALDDQPLQLVENVGFKRLLHLLAPSYTVPNQITFIRHVIPTLYAQCYAQMQAQLAKAEGSIVHFTTDISISQNATHAYLSLTAHWWQMDEAGVGISSSGGTPAGYRWALLHTQVMDQSHTSAYILEAIRGMMESWLVDKDIKKGFFIIGNSSNMIRAVGDGGYKGIQCFAHLLHLVVKDALGLGGKDGDSIVLNDLIERCRKIARHFNQSIKGCQQLRQKQALVGAPLNNLVQDVDTRWNSTYLMLQRLVEQQTPLRELSLEAEIGLDHPLGYRDWLYVTQVAYVLKPFKDATDAISLSTATLGEVIPIVNLLEQKLEGFYQEQGIAEEVLVLVKCLQLQLQNRLKPLTHLDCCMLATICDPRVKGSIALQSNTLCYWKEKLVARVQECELKRQRGSVGERVGSPCSIGSLSSTSSATTYSPSFHHFSHLDAAGRAFLTQAIASAVGSRGVHQHPLEETPAETSVKRYLAEPIEVMSTDPLAYWAHKAAVWPDLAKVAQHFLSCPPTSVPSKQVFSMAGDIVSPHHSQLAPELVEQLVFIKINLPLLGFPEFPCEWQEE